MPASITIEINGNKEDIHLATPHTGALAGQLRDARKAFNKAERAQGSLLKKVIFLSDKADRLAKRSADADINDELVAMSEQQDALMDELSEKQEDTLDAAVRFLSLALQDTYPAEKVDEIMGALTDEQVKKCVQIQASGQVPADFFPSPATQPNPNGTGPGESTTPESSSSTDSQEATSPVAG